MKYTSIEAAENIHKAYLQCKTTFNPEFTLINNTVNFESEEEKFFYKMVSDFFIGRRQMEVIKQENHGKG